jgi:hypothetical protein
MPAVPKLSWREFISDKLLSLPPDELHRIGMELGLIQAGEPVAPGEVASLLLRRAASKHIEEELVAAVSRSLNREAPPD